MASSVPQYPSINPFLFYNEYYEFQTPIGGSATWADVEGFPFFESNEAAALLDTMVLPETDHVTSSFKPAPPIPERFGVSPDMAVPVLAEFNHGLSGIIAGGSESFESSAGSGVCYMQDVCEFGEEYCNGIVPQYYQAVYPSSSNDNWGINQVAQVPTMEETSSKVGKYSTEERKDRILRYLKKRNQRNFNKTIKYECRKTLADKRVRVRGRFARHNELCEGNQTVLTKKQNYNDDNNNFHEDGGFNEDDNFKINYDAEDDWLQEAISSLMYLPCVSD